MGLCEKAAEILTSAVLLACILPPLAVSFYRDWLKSRGRFKAIMIPLSPVRALDVEDLSYEAFQREARAVDVFDEAALELFLAKWRGRVPAAPPPRLEYSEEPVVSNLERITVKADGVPIIDVPYERQDGPPSFPIAAGLLGAGFGVLGTMAYMFGKRR